MSPFGVGRWKVRRIQYHLQAPIQPEETLDDSASGAATLPTHRRRCSSATHLRRLFGQIEFL